jgi:hypothetical protein
VAELEDSTVIADFFLPYICGPDCATVQYQLPPDRFQVTTSVACTNGDGVAEVSVQAPGASGSLSVRVDQGPFEPLTGPLLLSAGDHTLVVRDSAGAESVPVGVTVPPPLRIIDTRVEVNNAGTAWRVSFTIDGGTAPYLADAGAIAGQSYTSPALPVADILTVEITDAAGCTVAGRFESGVKPCELPCDGDAIRAGYRFWLPTLPVTEYKSEVKTFKVLDAAGTSIGPNKDDIGAVMANPPNTVTIATVNRWLRAINKKIRDAVGGSDQWLTLEHVPAAGAVTTGTLFVDRLECLDFTFVLAVSFVQDKRRFAFELSYSSGGTVIVDLSTDAKARIPVYDVSTSNKCRPGDPVPLCEGTDLQVEIRRDGMDPDPIVLTAGTSGADARAVFFWEIQDGIPSLAVGDKEAGGDKVKVTFKPVEPVEKLVRLTVFTEEGCVVMVDKVINIRKPED